MPRGRRGPAADTVSIAVMELVDNATVSVIPGALDAGLADILLWASLLGSLVIAFVITVLVNRWMISRGKGHAVAHEFHRGATHEDHATIDDLHAGAHDSSR
jgi:hypothetical protein